MTADVKHLPMEDLEARLEEIGQSPRDEGVLDLIVRRPRSLERELLLPETCYTPFASLI
jgi:hypothetical protein